VRPCYNIIIIVVVFAYDVMCTAVMSRVRGDRFVSSQGRGPLSDGSPPTPTDRLRRQRRLYTIRTLLLLLLLYTLHDILIHMHTHDPRRSVAARLTRKSADEERNGHKLEALLLRVIDVVGILCRHPVRARKNIISA